MREAGSEEHLPGSAALNDKPVVVKYLRTEGSHLRPVETRFKKGFVVRTICDHCNKSTGGSYGSAFKDFALQFAASGVLAAPESSRSWISLKSIQPLRVLKQIAAMVLAAQPTLVNPNKWKPIQRFVVRQREKLPRDCGRFFIYRNTSNVGRISALASMGMMGRLASFPTLIFSEVCWTPLGIVFALDSHPYLSSMKDITEWGSFEFNDSESLEFTVPRLRVEANWPLAFGTAAQADRWISENHVMMLLFGNSAGDDPTQVSALIRPQRRLGE